MAPDSMKNLGFGDQEAPSLQSGSDGRGEQSGTTSK